jgi:hypothetical protein
MADTVNILNGGEAPHAANAVSNPDLASGGDVGAASNDGGQAPDPSASGTPAAGAQPQAAIAGDMSAPPPQGGGVHAP